MSDFAPDSLSSFYLDIYFDPAALNFDSYSLGSFLGDISLGEATDVSYGDLGSYVEIFEDSDLPGSSLDEIQPGSFTLVTLDFTVGFLAEGDFTTVRIGTVWGLLDGDRLNLTLDGTTDATIRNPANSVPEPSTLALLGLGLVGLGSARRRVTSVLSQK